METKEHSSPLSVPVVDLRDWDDELTSPRFARAFGDALREFGFVRVRGHQLDTDVVDEAYAASKDLFRLPSATKHRYVVKGAAGQRGYTPLKTESAKDCDLPDLKEFWHVGRELPEGHPLSDIYSGNVWPEEIDSFRPRVSALYESLDNCASKLLRALAFYLDVPENSFEDLTRDGDTVLRLLHYPPLDDSTVLPGAVRAAAHEDINLITLLITSTTSGLELKLRDGSWLSVNPQPGEIVVDSGDMMCRITDGYLPATTHRVVNPDDGHSERFSLPFFVHPRPDATLKVIEHYRNPALPEPTPDILAADFLGERLVALGLL